MPTEQEPGREPKRLAMPANQLRELRDLIVTAQDMAYRLGGMLDRAEVALAELAPGGDQEKQRETERAGLSPHSGIVPPLG